MPVGTAATVLRPSGVAEFDGVRLDVVTEGEFLSPGTPVQVDIAPKALATIS